MDAREASLAIVREIKGEIWGGRCSGRSRRSMGELNFPYLSVLTVRTEEGSELILDNYNRNCADQAAGRASGVNMKTQERGLDTSYLQPRERKIPFFVMKRRLSERRPSSEGAEE